MVSVLSLHELSLKGAAIDQLVSGSWMYVAWHVLYVLWCSSLVAVVSIVVVVVPAVAVVEVIAVIAIIITVVFIVIAVVSSLVICGGHHVVLPWPFVLLSIVGSSIVWVVPGKPVPGSFF